MAIPNGKLLYYDKNEVYEGNVNSDFERHGQGKYTFSNGDIYEGDFYCDEITGKGVKIYKNGDIYNGEFLRGERYGQGRMFYEKDKRIYEGQWRDD